nr:DUF6415 family natural product biosynthesis protein [Streptomyces caatingaensis]
MRDRNCAIAQGSHRCLGGAPRPSLLPPHRQLRRRPHPSHSPRTATAPLDPQRDPRGRCPLPAAPPIERVHALIARLYCYISMTAMELESIADNRPADDPVRERTLAAVQEARRGLAQGPGNGYISALTYTRTLSRSAAQLLPHHTQLTNAKENS